MKKPVQPCGRNCERRAFGCAASCPEWAGYVAERNAFYVAVHKIKEEANAARNTAKERMIRRMKEGFE